jgi:hypothetical protein
MTLLFSLVSDNLNRQILIELINSTPEIDRVILIQEGSLEIKFKRKIELIKLDYDEIFLGNYLGYEKNYRLDIEENNFLKNHHTDILFMMNRIHRLYSYSFVERYNMLKNQIKGAIGLFNEYNPDLCLFMNMPHEIFDYTFFKVAEYRNIKRKFLFQGAQLDGYYQILDNIKGNDPTLTDYVNKPELLSKNLKKIVSNYLEPSHEVFYMKKGWKSHSRSQKGLEKIKIKVKTHFNFLKKANKNGRLFEYLFIHLLFHNYERFLIKISLHNWFNKTLNDKYKFILVPLHLEPELTTSPMGGAFYDQMEMIELIDRNCPAGYKIIVKEHPVQKINHTRGKYFFKKIKSFKNVIYIDKSFNASKNFIEISDIIATLTGSLGFEALCKNKKVIVFGEPFYMHYKGCYKINNDNDFLEFIKNKDTFTNNSKDFNKFLNNCESKFHLGYIDLDFASRSSISFDDNAVNIALNVRKSFGI